MTSPVASDIYREAPDKIATVHVTNLLLVGAEGSGKTSLSRCFQGKQFRIKEASTVLLSLPQNYCELVGHRDWLAKCTGLSYERDLVRIIAAELLKSIQPPSPSPPPLSPATAFFPLAICQTVPPQLPSLTSHPAFSSHPVLPQGPLSPLPPLPPARKMRASSLNTDNLVSPRPRPPLSKRFSMNLEADREKHRFGIPTSGSHPEGLSDLQNGSPSMGHHRRFHITKKFSLSKLFGAHRKFSKSSKFEPVTVAPYSPPLPTQRSSSPTEVSLAARTSPQPCKRSLSVPDKFSSALPEQLEGKVKEKLKDCVAGTIPAEVYGRIVDCPSNGVITALEPLLLTDSAVVLAVFDVSKQIGNTGCQNGLTSSRHASPLAVTANQLVTQVMLVCQKWLATEEKDSVLSPQIILVGTHTDKTSTTEARASYDAARKMLKSSPCGRFLSSAAFFISCSSTIDRGVLEEFKRYIVDMVKKQRKEEVPLRWLRCIRRFQNMAKAGQYLLSDKDCHGIVKELCATKEESEVRDILRFLNRHLIILQFPEIHSLQSVVVTDPAWLFTQIVSLFIVLQHAPIAKFPQELSGDLVMLYSRGTLSDKLLDHIWHFSTFEKRELLLLLCVLELICLLGKDSQPILPWSLELGHSISPRDKRPPASSPMITAVIVPSLVREPCPSSVSHPSTPGVEPLYFAFRLGVLPGSFFPRLIVRCMQNYSVDYVLYQDVACFSINADSTLVLQACADSVKATLQPMFSTNFSSPPSPVSSSPSAHLESSLSEAAMTARMFLQAAVADITKQWLPGLCCEPCFLCHCAHGHTHYTAISNVESITDHAVMKCQLGNTVTLPATAAPWFGEELKTQEMPPDDEAGEYHNCNHDDSSDHSH